MIWFLVILGLFERRLRCNGRLSASLRLGALLSWAPYLCFASIERAYVSRNRALVFGGVPIPLFRERRRIRSYGGLC